MSKGRRNRRPNGHPARVAARREREELRRSAEAPSPLAGVREVVKEVEELATPLDVELWASHMLGVMWEERTDLMLDEDEDYTLVLGEPLVETIARTGRPGRRTALLAIAAVDDGELAGVARRLADQLPKHESEPTWLPSVGQATITAAAVMHEDIFDDGLTLFLEACHETGVTQAVGVHIDNNQGEMATDILVTDSLNRVAEVIREHSPDDGEFRLERIEPAQAAAHIQEAMVLTEMTVNPPVTEDYPALRALALMRARQAPRPASVPEHAEVPVPERHLLRDEFLAAPEGQGFAADGDEAFAVSLAIDFCADYVDGRPLRWSPALVELFMTEWVPRKVIADADLISALPAALDAWLRFAGRKRGLPQWAIKATREAIARWRDEMTEAMSDPAFGSPAK